MYDDFNENRSISQSYSVLKTDLEYMKKNNLSATDIVRDYLKNHRKSDKKNKIEIYKNRVIIVFVGFILFLISGFRSIDFPFDVLFFISGMLFVFYGVFDLLMKIIPTVKNSWGK